MGKHTLFIYAWYRGVIFLLVSLNILNAQGQDFVNKDFYLIDSLSLRSLNEEERKLIDSCLVVFHKSKHDTSRIKSLRPIIQRKSLSYRHLYLKKQRSLIEAALNKKIPKQEFFVFKKLQARNLLDHGNRFYDISQFSTAKNYFLKALNIYLDINYKKGISKSYNNIASLHQIQGELSEAMDYYRKSVKISVETQNFESLGRSVNNISSILTDKKDTKGAIRFAKRALKIFHHINDKNRISYTLNNLGNTYQSIDEYDKALDFYKKSLRIKEEIGEPSTIGNTLYNIANTFESKGDMRNAIINYQKSAEIFKKIDDKRRTAHVLSGIGHIYNNQENMPKALQYYAESLNLAKKCNDQFLVSSSMTNLAGIQTRLGEFEKARLNLQNALVLNKKTKHLQGMGFTLTGLGDLHEKRDRDEEALKYFQKGLVLFKKLNRPLGVAILKKKIGYVYLKLHKLDSAEFFAKQALEEITQLGATGEILDVSRILGKIYETKGDGISSLNMYKLCIEIRDSVRNIEIKERLANLELKYRVEKKNQQIKMLNKENKLRKSQLVTSILLSILILALLLGSTVYWYFKRKKRFENELNQLRALKLEVTDKNNPRKRIDSIPVKYGKKMSLININDITHFSTQNKYTLLNNKEGKSFVIDYTMAKLEELLPDHFNRVHRSFIVNKNEIQEITKTYKGKVILTMKDQVSSKVPSSQGYSKKVKQLIEGFNLN